MFWRPSDSGSWFGVDVMIVTLDAALILVETLRDMGVNPGLKGSHRRCPHVGLVSGLAGQHFSRVLGEAGRLRAEVL